MKTHRTWIVLVGLLAVSSIALLTAFGYAASFVHEAHLVVLLILIMSTIVLALILALHRSFHDAQHKALQHETLFNNAPDALICVTSQGDIVKANTHAAKLLGYSLDELTHMRVEELLPKDIRTAHKSYRSGYFQHPQTRPMGVSQNLCAITKSGEAIEVDISLSHFGENGNSIATAAIRDVRESRQLFRELETANKKANTAMVAKSRLLHTLSHELRTPLNHILGFSGLLETEEKIASTPKLKEYVNLIFQAAQYQLKMIEAVASYAEFDETQDEASSNFDPKQLIDEVIQTAQTQEANLKAVIDVSYADDLPGSWQGRGFRLKFTLDELITNAIKFNAAPEPKVSISAVREENNLKISVTDNGPGIAPQDCEKIFDTFERLDADIHAVEGIGMGLPIAQQHVQVLGGQMWAEGSTDGTTVHICLNPPH